jgi:hypothetical protein
LKTHNSSLIPFSLAEELFVTVAGAGEVGGDVQDLGQETSLQPPIVEEHKDLGERRDAI